MHCPTVKYLLKIGLYILVILNFVSNQFVAIFINVNSSTNIRSYYGQTTHNIKKDCEGQDGFMKLVKLKSENNKKHEACSSAFSKSPYLNIKKSFGPSESTHIGIS